LLAKHLPASTLTEPKRKLKSEGEPVVLLVPLLQGRQNRLGVFALANFDGNGDNKIKKGYTVADQGLFSEVERFFKPAL
jgi:hypothetical protein